MRTDGNLLIIQPAQNNPIVQVEVDGELVFKEETNEKNFRGYLSATMKAIQKSVEEKRFEIVSEAIIPSGKAFHCNEYDSINDWVEDRIAFCEDVSAFNAMAERIQDIIRGREHKVFEFWREYKVLLRKPG